MTREVLHIIYFIYTLSFYKTQSLLVASGKAQLFPGKQTIKDTELHSWDHKGADPSKTMGFPSKHQVMVQVWEDLAGGDNFMDIAQNSLKGQQGYIMKESLF